MRSALNLFLPLALAAVASAQCMNWSEEFEVVYPTGSVPWIPWDVRAAVQFDDGTGSKTICGGTFTTAGGSPLSFIGAWDGAQWAGLDGGVDGFVTALHVHDFGQGPRLVAGGNFLTAGTVPANRIAVWDGSSWSPLGLGLNNVVLTLETFDDGTGPALYAGGVFTQSGSTTVNRIARWDGTSWLPVGAGADSVVRALEAVYVGSERSLYVGGEFVHAGGVLSNYIARWNGTTWSALGVGVGAAVNALEYAPPGSSVLTGLYVGGDFGTAGSLNVTRLARWTGSNWAAGFGSLNGPVNALRMHDDGSGLHLYIGGWFSSSDGHRLVRLNTSGSLSQVGSGPGLGFVYALASQGSAQGSRLFAGGTRGTSEGPSFVYWDGRAWGVTAGGQGLMRVREAGQATELVSARVAGRTDLYALGDFVEAGAAPGRYIARWDGTSWSSIGALNVYSVNTSLVGFDDGTGPALYVAGPVNIVGTSVSYVARWNGTGWSALGAGLNGYATAVAVHDDGTGPALYVVGAFTAAGGQPASRIARWNGTSWSALGAGLDGQPIAMGTYDDGSGSKLYVSGVTLAGVPFLSGIACWDGTAWSNLGGLASSQVWSMVVHDDGSGEKLYVGGLLSGTGGPAGLVASWDGQSWTSVGSPSNGMVFTLASHDGGEGRRLFAGGVFTTIGGVDAHKLAQWDGSTWSSTPGPLVHTGNATTLVSALCSWDDGRGQGPALFVGGSFTEAGGVPSSGIAALRGCRISRFCSGDGLDPLVTTACPCGNLGASGNGCAWHTGPAGASLAASGRIESEDELVLTASGMPASAPSTVFLKGDAQLAGGVVFGDGVRCVGGNLIRLGTKTNVSGAARYPEAGNAPISVRGGTPVGSGAIGYYQTYYRNAASFCTSSTFNVTNGVRVVW